MEKTKARMTKETVPEGFTCGMATVDAIPVLLFGISCLIIGVQFHSVLFLTGAVLCLVGGGGKVLWKFIVALRKKNIWFLFVQMRILMPAGFLLMLLSLWTDRAKWSPAGLVAAVTSMPSAVFFALGLLGMILMGVFAVKLDNSDPRANWIEQGTNGLAQLAICIGLLFL